MAAIAVPFTSQPQFKTLCYLLDKHNRETLLVQSCKTDELAEMSGIKLGLSPFKPNRGKNVSRRILQQLVKIWHNNSNFVTDKSKSLSKKGETQTITHFKRDNALRFNNYPSLTKLSLKKSSSIVSENTTTQALGW